MADTPKPRVRMNEKELRKYNDLTQILDKMNEKEKGFIGESLKVAVEKYKGSVTHGQLKWMLEMWETYIKGGGDANVNESIIDNETTAAVRGSNGWTVMRKEGKSQDEWVALGKPVSRDEAYVVSRWLDTAWDELVTAIGSINGSDEAAF
jgi:hypothetical protein